MSENLFEVLQERLPSFSKGQKRIATYIIENSESASFLTAAKLGKAVGVSESTVVRFAAELGYDGYPKMQDAMQKRMLNRVTSALIAVTDRSNPVAERLRAEAMRLYQTADVLRTETVSAVVSAMQSAKHIYLQADSSVAILAEYAGYHLRILSADVRVITASEKREALEQLLYVDAGDVLISFGFSEDISAEIIGAQYCKSKGAVVIAIADSQLSPLAQESDYVLVAKAGQQSVGKSLVGPMGMINALFLELCAAKEEALIEQRNRLDRFLKEYTGREK